MLHQLWHHSLQTSLVHTETVWHPYGQGKILGSLEKITARVFGMKWEWVHDDRIYFMGELFLKKSTQSKLKFNGCPIFQSHSPGHHSQLSPFLSSDLFSLNQNSLCKSSRAPKRKDYISGRIKIKPERREGIWRCAIQAQGVSHVSCVGGEGPQSLQVRFLTNKKRSALDWRG